MGTEQAQAGGYPAIAVRFEDFSKSPKNHDISYTYPDWEHVTVSLEDGKQEEVPYDNHDTKVFYCKNPRPDLYKEVNPVMELQENGSLNVTRDPKAQKFDLVWANVQGETVIRDIVPEWILDQEDLCYLQSFPDQETQESRLMYTRVSNHILQSMLYCNDDRLWDTSCDHLLSSASADVDAEEQESQREWNTYDSRALVIKNHPECVKLNVSAGNSDAETTPEPAQ